MQGQFPNNREKGWRLAAENNKGEALTLLLSNRSEDEISLYLMALVALKLDPDTLEWVLRESKIQFTTLVDELVNYWEEGKVIVQRLMARYKPSEVSQTLLEYAAKFCSGSTFDSLLPQTDDTGISWDLILERAGYEGNVEVVILLLNKKDLQITPIITRGIAISGDKKVMQLLLDRDDSREITSEIFNAVF